MDKLKEAITRATEKSLSIVVLQTEDAKELEAKLQVAVEALEKITDPTWRYEIQDTALAAIEKIKAK